jgi:hypothetical protein
MLNLAGQLKLSNTFASKLTREVIKLFLRLLEEKKTLMRFSSFKWEDTSVAMSLSGGFLVLTSMTDIQQSLS